MSQESVVGVVSRFDAVGRVVADLKRAHFAPENISVLFPDREGARDLAYETHSKAHEAALAGAGAGGAMGGAIGLLAGVGALAIPGLGPFLAAGPIVALMSGAAAGATMGGVAGGLIGLGVPKIEAKVYDGKIPGSGILVVVHIDSPARRAEARDILERDGASNVMAM